MFNELSYKKKFFGVLLVLAMLSIVSYKRSFKVVYETKNSANEVNDKLKLINGSNEKIKFLLEKVNGLDRLIGKEVEPELVQHFLIDFVSQFKNVEIVKLEEMHSSIDDKFRVYTNQLVLQGNYNDLINAIYSIEQKFETSRIRGINFYKKTDYRMKKQQLFVKLIFQNYEKNV